MLQVHKNADIVTAAQKIQTGKFTAAQKIQTGKFTAA